MSNPSNHSAGSFLWCSRGRGGSKPKRGIYWKYSSGRWRGGWRTVGPALGAHLFPGPGRHGAPAPQSFLLLSELGGHILSPEQAPAGTKRLSNLLALPKSQTLLERFLWYRADQALDELPGGTPLALWDESVLEKPESIARRDWGHAPARPPDSSASSLATTIAGGPPVFVRVAVDHPHDSSAMLVHPPWLPCAGGPGAVPGHRPFGQPDFPVGPVRCKVASR